MLSELKTTSKCNNLKLCRQKCQCKCVTTVNQHVTVAKHATKIGQIHISSKCRYNTDDECMTNHDTSIEAPSGRELT